MAGGGLGGGGGGGGGLDEGLAVVVAVGGGCSDRRPRGAQRLGAGVPEATDGRQRRRMWILGVVRWMLGCG